MTIHRLERPRQAVILAGGRGTRLLPLTESRPKPMLRMNRRPFLEYLIEMLAEQGFQRILLLLGYLPDVVEKHFSNGRRWGIRISYSITPVDDDTGLRLRSAYRMLDDCFLLMYCDNYWPMRFTDMWRQYVRAGSESLVTVYNNEDEYSRNNVKVAGDGLVLKYDKSRQDRDVNGVDIGFMIMRRHTVASLPTGNFSLEQVLYPRLIERRELVAFRTDHRYYSVGSHERLPLTEQFLARYPTVLLDRDGVLNEKMPRARYVESWADWAWIPGSRDALRRLHEAGHRVLVVTNQPGIARGKLTESTLQRIHERMRSEAAAAGGHITAVYHCPHGWRDGCSCRKPRPGMLFQAQRDYNLDLSRVYFIGDDDRDGEAAVAAGSPFIQVRDDRPMSKAVDTLLDSSRPHEL